MVSDLKQELIARFIDIGGIIDHHCLNILSITEVVMTHPGIPSLLLNRLKLVTLAILRNNLLSILSVIESRCLFLCSDNDSGI